MSADDSPVTYVGDGPPTRLSTPATVSRNVVHDLVKFIRSNTIRNEQQFVLFTLGYISGYMEDPDDFISGIGIGTSSSGKTHVQRQVEKLWANIHDHLYEATGGSDKSMVYDETWDTSYIASLDELNKIPDALVEFLKSTHGGDGSFVYKTTRGSVRDGFTTEEIERKAKPYWFLYAQYEPDFELWNRLLKVPVHESESKNRAVGSMAFDHHHIAIGDDGIKYGFDYEEGTKELQTHIASIHENAPGRVLIPNGGDYGWDVWSIVEPIFNHSRSEVNRIYTMVASLIRCSALLNYHARDVVSVDGEDHLVAEPQDVANILGCREVLLASTHEIDKKKRAICEAIDVKSGAANEIEGIGPIREFLNESDSPMVKETELTHILEDLQDNYLIDIHEGAGDGGKDIYEFLGWDELGFARVKEHASLFEDCIDPFTDTPFVEAHAKMRDELDTDASELLQQATTVTPTGVSASSSDDDDDSTGGGTLGAYGGGAPTDDDDPVELDPVEESVARYAKAVLDGERVDDLREVPVEAFLGLVPLDEPDRPRDNPSGSPLDSSHEMWDRSDKPTDWVTTEQDARREIKKAIKRLIEKNVIRFDEVFEATDDGAPIDAILSVVPE